MRDGYVYYAQSKAHPGDPMYSVANVRKCDLAAQLRGVEDKYIVFRYAPDGRCKVISLNEVPDQGS